MGRNAQIRSLSEHIFQGPLWCSPPPLRPPTKPHQREKPHPQSPLHPSLKVPGGWALLQVPPKKRGPYGKRCLSLEPFLHILQGPQQGSPPSRFPSQSSHRERHHTSRAPFNHISKSPVDEPSSRFPSRDPYGKRCPSPEHACWWSINSKFLTPRPRSNKLCDVASARTVFVSLRNKELMWWSRVEKHNIYGIKSWEVVHRHTQRVVEKFTIFQVTYCHSHDVLRRTDGPGLGVTTKR